MKKLKEWFKNRSVNQMAWFYAVLVFCLLLTYVYAICKEPGIFFITCVLLLISIVLTCLHRAIRQILVKRERNRRR